MRQGKQRRAAAGVRAGRLSLGRPGGLETGPGGHRESCLGGSLVRVCQGWQGEGLGTREDLQGPVAPWAWHVDASPRGPWPATPGSQPKGSHRLEGSVVDCRGTDQRGHGSQQQHAGLSRAPQPGPRCPHRDPNRLSAPGGVGVIRSLCLLPWRAPLNLSS